MMNDEEGFNKAFTSRRDDLQMVILTQLLQAATAMHHIDELLWWLANLMVHRFGVQVAQAWATQESQDRQHSSELRSVAYLDVTFPQNLVVNAQVAAIAGQLLAARRSSPMQLVDITFPQHLATLFKRHGLNYFSSFFLSSPFLFLPPPTGASPAKVPTPLAMIFLLFFRQFPPQDFPPIIGSICQQALPIARNRGLLLSAPPEGTPSPGTAANFSSQPSIAVLSELIPRRVQDIANNPFGNPTIPDKLARRLYAAIDDRRDIGELSGYVQLDMKTVFGLLQMLLKQQRIQLYEPGGRLVDGSSLLNNQ